MGSHVYWSVECKTCGCNEWIYLCHIGTYDPHKRYTYKGLRRFEVTCPGCGVTHLYGERDVRASTGEAPDRRWVDYPHLTAVA
jgi:hypothetical protein